MNMKTAIYLRVSTEGNKNGREQDTAMQRNDIVAYLKSKGINEFEEYEDVGYSGTKKDRPDLKKLLQDCRTGKISRVVCWKLDRLFRSLKHMIDTVAEFQDLNVELVAVKDSINLDSATGKLLFHILACFAEFEAATIRERVNSGLENARNKGKVLGRPRKKGVDIIKKLWSQGKTARQIADQLEISNQSVYRALNKE